MSDALIIAQATTEAAIIGGGALALGVFFSWLTSMHLQKIARLAETRKQVYLDLVDSYSKINVNLHLLFLDINSNLPNFITSIIDFSNRLDKAMFICNTDTKILLNDFAIKFGDFFNNVCSEVKLAKELAIDLDNLAEQHEDIIKRFKEAQNFLQGIVMEDPESSKINKILDYSSLQLEYSKKHIPLINEKEEELKTEIERVKPIIDKLLKDLSKDIPQIVHKLRKELGAKTDIKQDLQISLKNDI